MTNEEAKKMLEAKLKCLIAETSGTNYDCNMRLCDGCSLNYEQGNMREQKQALDMAIQALEQQPCEDAVSRSELQKTMDSLPLFRFVNNDHEEADDYYNCESVDMVIRNLPSVTPRINLALTSQDCISREAVLSLQTEYAEKMDATTFWNLRDDIRGLPPVKPKYTDEEIDKAQAVEQAYVDKMVELAVEEAKRPKGKWIETPVENDIVPVVFKCSECGMRVVNPYKYCPNCGAEMSGGGEDEVSD